MVDIVFNELVLFDILLLAVDNPDCKELIFDLLTVLSACNELILDLFWVLSPCNEPIFDLLTVLSPCNELILVVWTSICCWNVFDDAGTLNNKLLNELLIFVLSWACFET